MVAASAMTAKAQELLAVLTNDPFKNFPSQEKLVGDLVGAWSQCISIQDRPVYKIFAKERIVRVLRMWSHYD